MTILIPVLITLAGAPQQPPSPALTVDPSFHDFGPAVAGQVLRRSFTLRNASSAKVFITKLESSCGCTTATPSKTSLEPGEQTSFDVVLETKGLRGNLTKTVDITCGNASQAPTPPVRLTMKVQVAPRLKFDPPVASFLEAPFPASKEITLKLLAGDGAPLPAIRSIHLEGASTECLEASPALVAGAQQPGPAVRILFDPLRAPAGVQRGQARLHVETSDTADPHLFIPVEWSIKAPIRPLPERVLFVYQRGVLMTPRAVVGLKQMDGKPFKVLSIELPSWLSFEIAPGREGGPLHTAVFTLGEGAPKERFSGTVTFLTDAPPPANRITLPLGVVGR